MNVDRHNNYLLGFEFLTINCQIKLRFSNYSELGITGTGGGGRDGANQDEALNNKGN